MVNEPLFIIIDLFCGAGGTTTGFVQAELPGLYSHDATIDLALKCLSSSYSGGREMTEQEKFKLAKVIACVNHDSIAIKSHWLNHPEVKHFEEDIRTLDLTELKKLVEHYRKLYPNAFVILWASLECTNFSQAKGGQARDADSRTLALHLYKYVHDLKPDYIQIENVVEFMSWGPMKSIITKTTGGYDQCIFEFKETEQAVIGDDGLYVLTKDGSCLFETKLKPVFKGVPESRDNGKDWLRWCKTMNKMGYEDSWKQLNSANFGAYTSRNRLFGVFAKDGLPIAWPEITHAKNPSKFSMHGDLQKWKAVKDVLNFKDEGQSIFTRKKPLSDKTLERIYAGLIKYVAKGDTAFISKYFSGRPKGKVNSVNDPCPTNTTFGGNSLIQTKSFSDLSLDSPAGAVTTIDHHALVQTIPFITQRNTGDANSKIVDVDGPARTITGTGGNQDLVQAQFLLKYNSTNKNGKHTPPSIDEPCPVVSTQGRLGVVSPEFLAAYYGNGDNVSSVDSPCPVIPTKDRFGVVQPEFFIDKHYGKTSQNQSINDPAGVIMPNDKHRLVEAVPFIMPTSYDNKPKSVDEPAPTITASRKHHYIVNPSHGGHCTSTDAPCPVIVARQDKAPLYVVFVENGPVGITVFDGDSEIMIRIKEFMCIYGLVDIKMRMLRVLELLSIQGFPFGYKLEGNQSDQKKFIGNSVVPHVVKAWTEAMAQRIIDNRKNKVA